MIPELIVHRRNRICELNSANPEWGVEVDLRSSVQIPGGIHLSHDPWSEGDFLEDWLKAFRARGIKGTLILNTKEDGLEMRVLELLKKYEIDQYFFLDTALPTLVSFTFRQENSHFAIRYSQYEPLEAVRLFRGKAEWVWVDCFDALPVPVEAVKSLKSDFKVCLVSPELQKGMIQADGPFTGLLPYCDAICTKDPEAWEKIGRSAGFQSLRQSVKQCLN